MLSCNDEQSNKLGKMGENTAVIKAEGTRAVIVAYANDYICNNFRLLKHVWVALPHTSTKLTFCSKPSRMAASLGSELRLFKFTAVSAVPVTVPTIAGIRWMNEWMCEWMNEWKKLYPS